MLIFYFLTAAVTEALIPGLGRVTLGGFVGYALGYTIKKTVKIIMIIIGIFIGLSTLLASQNLVVINWAGFELLFQKVVENQNLSVQNLGQWLGAYIPLTGGVVAGFLLGFRKG